MMATRAYWSGRKSTGTPKAEAISTTHQEHSQRQLPPPDMFLVLCRHENLRALQSDAVPENSDDRRQGEFVGGGVGPGLQADLWAGEDSSHREGDLQTKPKGMTQWSCD